MKADSVLALESLSIQGVLVEFPGRGVEKLNGRLRNGIHAIFPQGGDVRPLDQMFQMIVSGAAGQNALFRALKISIGDRGMSFNADDIRQGHIWLCL